MSRMPDVGDVVDDVFHVEDELDHGNFGAIYRVRDMVEDRTLALKIQKPGPHDEEEVRQRFEREARLIYSLDHRNVVQVLYYGETDDGLPYMAMEFLEGTDLKRLLRGGYDLEADQIKRISLETLSALKAAHRIGIVHRDLKPANIFLVDDGKQGYVKVLDFGFAKALDDDNNREITRAGTLVGSPAYMAPELVHKKQVGAHSDLYAMGLIMAEMITGEKAVQIENIYDTIVYQGSDDPVHLAPEVQQSPFGDVIRRAVQKEIKQRYRSAERMINDLKSIDVGAEKADLQQHAGVENRQFAPFVVGSADQNAETQPRSHGMPSVQEVDDEIGQGGDGDQHPSGPHRPVTNPGKSQPSRRRTSSEMNAVQGRGQQNDRPTQSGRQRRVDSQSHRSADRRHSTGPRDAVRGDGQNRSRRSQSGRQVAVDSRKSSDRRSTTGSQRVVRRNQNDGGSRSGRQRTQNPGAHETIRPTEGEKLRLDMDRPSSSKDASSSHRSLLSEILLGVLIGSVVLVVILVVLVFLR